MKRFSLSLLSLFHLFGGLIVYWGIFLLFGIKPAIAATLVFIVVEYVWRVTTHRPFPVLWWFSNGMALVFGVIDLYADSPFMLRYEATVSNLLTAAFFAAGAVGEKPLILQFAQRSPNAGDIPTDRPELMRFFRAFTLLWAAYFVFRAGLFLWIMQNPSLSSALLLRTLAGWGSLALMVLLSMNGRHVFLACQRIGWFRPTAPAQPAPNLSTPELTQVEP